MITRTAGSSAAAVRNAPTELSKLSYGWCTSTSRSRSVWNTAAPARSAPPRPRNTSAGVHGASLCSSGRALVQLEQRAEIEQAGRLVQLVALEAQLAQQEIADPRIEVGRHLEANGVARAPAPVEARLHRLHEVAARAALLVEVEVGVARHAEEARARDLVLGEQQAEVRADHLFDGRVAARADLPPARQKRRHLHAREPARTAAARLHERAHREREPGDEGEGVRGVDAERDQHRRDLLVERRERARALLVGELVPVREVDSRAAQRGPQLALERLVRGPRQLEHALADRRELRAGREPVGRGGLVALRHEVLELRHPHLEELVEVAREDREELRALEDRPPRVARELEHAAVELEPGQLAVEETLGGVAHPTRVDRRPAPRADQTAVVGSIMRRTSVILLAGKPLFAAWSRIACSSSAR